MNPSLLAVPQITDVEFRDLRAWIYRHAGIHLSDQKKALVCGRLALRHPDRFTARLQFASWVALGLSMPPDLTHWLGLGEPAGSPQPGDG